jgi:hypothetical protein
MEKELSVSFFPKLEKMSPLRSATRSPKVAHLQSFPSRRAALIPIPARDKSVAHEQ